MDPGIDYIGVGCGALIVNDKDETLLIKRKSRNDIGKWNKPGGTVEFGETVQNAIKREVKEETGVEIELLEPLGFTNHIDTAEGRDVHWIAIHYLARIVAGEPRNLESEKADEIAWFPLNDLPDNLTLTTSEPIAYYLRLHG